MFRCPPGGQRPLASNTVTTRILRGGEGCSFGTMGPIARDVAAGSVLTQKLYFPYRCDNGTLEPQRRLHPAAPPQPDALRHRRLRQRQGRKSDRKARMISDPANAIAPDGLWSWGDAGNAPAARSPVR